MTRQTVADMARITADQQATKPRKCANNTITFMDHDGNTCWQLHRTVIVKRHPDGTFTLDSGGWPTQTTRDRINSCSPARAYIHKGDLYLGIGIPPKDGVRIDKHGMPVLPPDTDD